MKVVDKIKFESKEVTKGSFEVNISKKASNGSYKNMGRFIVKSESVLSLENYLVNAYKNTQSLTVIELSEMLKDNNMAVSMLKVIGKNKLK